MGEIQKAIRNLIGNGPRGLEISRTRSGAKLLWANSVFANPPVNPTPVVPNLEPFRLDGFYEVQILKTVHLAQDNVANPQVLGFDWNNRAELA